MIKLKAISGNDIREDIDYNTRGIDPEDKEWCAYGKELCDTLYYRKSEADKVIEKITEGAISMFRSPDKCRGLDLKSPLGKIANACFKHWNYVELIQSQNTQLQKDKERLLQNNHHLLDEVECLKEDVADARQKACVYQKITNETERRERHQKHKRCLAMAKWCEMCISYWDDDEQEGGWEYKKLRHCIRWKKRWEALAEQFKDKEAK